MASQILLKTASGIFLTGALGHAVFGINEIFQQVSPIKRADTRSMVKNIWLQLSGYLVVNSLLSWKWAEHGLQTSIDKSILGVIVAITSTAGLSYARQGIYLPPLLLISSSVALVLSQVV